MAQTSGNRDEPSMEDILSSIRKIIQSNEDNDSGNSAEQATAQKSAQAPAVETAVENNQAAPMQEAPVEPAKTVAVPQIKVSRPVDAVTPASVNADVQSERGELTDAPARAQQTTAEVETQVQEIPAPIAAAPITPVPMPKAEPTPSLAAQVVASAQEAGVEHVVAALEEELNSQKTEEVAASKETQNQVPALISEGSGAKVAASFAELAQTLEARSDMNLEDMASDMLRPMLQDWLDDNLPSLVEKLVREEIERVARGG